MIIENISCKKIVLKINVLVDCQAKREKQRGCLLLDANKQPCFSRQNINFSIRFIYTLISGKREFFVYSVRCLQNSVFQ